MDYRDAIAIIKEHIVDIHADPEIYEDGSKVDILHALEEFAIPAMEKEIARDVALKTATAYYGRQYYECPTCSDFIRWRFPNEINEYDYEPSRCPFCGQHLQWKV